MDQEQRQKYIKEYEELMKNQKTQPKSGTIGGDTGKNKQFMELDEEDPAKKMALQKETFKDFIKQKEVPTKAVFLAFMLCIVGIILLIIGSVKAFNNWEPKICAVYWIAGFLFAIPGIYFSSKVCKAYKTKDLGARRSILNEIPDM